MITLIPNRQNNLANLSVEQFILLDNDRRIATSALEFDKFELRNKSNALDTPTKMLTSLLRASLNGEEVDKSVFESATPRDWQKVISIADKSSVTGLIYDALNDKQRGLIPAETLVDICNFTRLAEKNHAKQEKILGELTEKFDKHGFEMVQLKGVGLSMSYPTPQHRHGGDIDIFVRAKNQADNSTTWDKINQILIGEGYDVTDYKNKRNKHSEFKYKGIQIENHNYFVNKKQIKEAVKIDEYLCSVFNPQLQTLPHGTKILVPSKEFNAVFIPQHAFQHFIYSGINFHHLTDWGMHLKRHGFEFPNELKGTKFEQFTYAFTNLSNKFLGTNIDVPKNEELESEILNMILNPKTSDIPEDYNKLQTLLFKMVRFYKNAKRAKGFTGESICSSFIYSCLKKLEDPKTLFMK